MAQLVHQASALAVLGVWGWGAALAQQPLPVPSSQSSQPQSASQSACQPTQAQAACVCIQLSPSLAQACADTLAAQAALDQGDVAHAQVLVELVLLNSPEWAPAHLLQVQLWHQTGKTAAAQDLARQLLQDAATPEHIRASLQSMVQQAVQPQPSSAALTLNGASPTGVMRVELGRDTNPAMLLPPGIVTLTFDGVDVSLQPSPESIARTVSTLRTAVAIMSPNQRHVFEAQHQAGQAARYQSLRYSHLLAGHPVWAPTWVRAGWLQDSLHAQRYTLESYWATPTAGHWQLRWQHQVQLKQLDAFEVRWLHPLGTTGWWFNTWADLPTSPQRPGGTRGGLALTGHIRQPLGKGALEASAASQFVHDSRGYSPLLSNNARRSVWALSARLSYQYPLTPRTQAEATLELERTHSNLPVFNRSRQGAYVGLRRSF